MISTEKAREILGECADNMSDDKIQSMLSFIYFVCEKIVESQTNHAN